MTLREYLQSQIDLIPENSNISNPTVNNSSKIIFVNGHWSTILPGPDKGGEDYWVNATAFSLAAANSFNLTTWENKFVDGAHWLWTVASTRQAAGKTWAQNNYNDLISHSSAVLDFYLVSHSQGGAFAAGIAEYLKSKGHNIKQMVFLSCHQGADIDTDNSIEMYQMLYGKWKTVIPNVLSAFVLDLVVGDHWVPGAKYGIIIRQDLDIQYLHGQSRVSAVFEEIEDLKDVMLTDVMGPDGHIYKGQTTVPNDTLFYSLDHVFIETNAPDFNP
ncbi:MAG TPA: hypothetical protein VL053_04315 [Arachidicoccus sp.]|nr:hypothetical protein [Arachidicoccus sp.]